MLLQQSIEHVSIVYSYNTYLVMHWSMSVIQEYLVTYNSIRTFKQGFSKLTYAQTLKSINLRMFTKQLLWTGLRCQEEEKGKTFDYKKNINLQFWASLWREFTVEDKHVFLWSWVILAVT